MNPFDNPPQLNSSTRPCSSQQARHNDGAVGDLLGGNEMMEVDQQQSGQQVNGRVKREQVGDWEDALRRAAAENGVVSGAVAHEGLSSMPGLVTVHTLTGEGGHSHEVGVSNQLPPQHHQ
jgi:hypothetical protein